jgi:hypothetical protein
MMRGVLVRTGRMMYSSAARPMEPEFGVMSLQGERIAHLVDWDEIRFDIGASGRVRATIDGRWQLNARSPLTMFLGHPCVVDSPGIVDRVRPLTQNTRQGHG